MASTQEDPIQVLGSKVIFPIGLWSFWDPWTHHSCLPSFPSLSFGMGMSILCLSPPLYFENIQFVGFHRFELEREFVSGEWYLESHPYLISVIFKYKFGLFTFELMLEGDKDFGGLLGRNRCALVILYIQFTPCPNSLAVSIPLSVTVLYRIVQNVDYHICSYLFPTNVFRTLLMFPRTPYLPSPQKTVSWPCIHTSLEMAFVQLMKKKNRAWNWC